MNRSALIAIAFALLAVSLAPASGQVVAKRPVVLLFETNKGEGADKELAASTTKALRNYLRQTEQVEVAVFNRESPTVVRAIMENRLTADQVASYSSQKQRLQVARILSYQFAAGSELSIKDGTIEVKLWVGKVDGKSGVWETTGYARASGADSLKLDNSMQSAASAAVIDLARKAFAELPRIPQAEPTTGAETTAISTPAAPAQPDAADYSSQAEASLKAGNLAMAIQEYSQAVNADPTNVELRIKLAEAYAHKGLYDEAYAELGRAAMIGASAETVDAAKARIEKMQNGQPVEDSPQPEQAAATAPEPAEQEPAAAVEDEPRPEAAQEEPSTPAPRDAAAAAIAKMQEGDKLWNSGRPDEAAEAYRQSLKLNPQDWRAHERLAVINASMSLFDESRKALERLKEVQPNPAPEVVENRYDMFRKAFDKHFAALLRQYDSDAVEFKKHSLTRESYYMDVKGIAQRLEAMTQFLDAIPVPHAKQPANLRRSLACGLMAQAGSRLLDYLETNSESARTEAETFASQAKKEIETAAKLETNTVVVSQ